MYWDNIENMHKIVCICARNSSQILHRFYEDCPDMNSCIKGVWPQLRWVDLIAVNLIDNWAHGHGHDQGWLFLVTGKPN